MRVWIYKLSEFTTWDVRQYGERKFRYAMLSDALVNAGHEVLWWTDDFQHFKKEKGHRFGKNHSEQVSPRITVCWVHSPGYMRNNSLRRFKDHHIVAKKMLADVDTWPKPDIILAGMPTDTMCEVATRVGSKYDVPVVLDVRDLWPDIFFSQLQPMLRPLAWLFTRKMNNRIKNCFSKAISITGNTEAFVDWGLEKGNRNRTGLDRAFPIGHLQSDGNGYEIDRVEKFWKDQGVTKDNESFKICFLGSISKMYDFAPLLTAARELFGDGYPVEFILCGEGPELHQIKKASAGLSNIILPGRLAANEIDFLLKISSVGIIPYIDHNNYRNNIANKAAEYLAASLPIFISIRGLLTELLSDYGCGNHYRNSFELVSQIRLLSDTPQLLRSYRENANRLFLEKLNAKKIYNAFSKHIENIAIRHKHKKQR
jgi:glycosyltransferase involved in cell wall biosynthesis